MYNLSSFFSRICINLCNTTIYKEEKKNTKMLLSVTNIMYNPLNFNRINLPPPLEFPHAPPPNSTLIFLMLYLYKEKENLELLVIQTIKIILSEIVACEYIKEEYNRTFYIDKILVFIIEKEKNFRSLHGHVGTLLRLSYLIHRHTKLGHNIIHTSYPLNEKKTGFFNPIPICITLQYLPSPPLSFSFHPTLV